MTQIQQEIINDKQLQCDLIEIGVTRAAGVLIKENMEAVDDEALTLQKVRLYGKISLIRSHQFIPIPKQRRLWGKGGAIRKIQF